MNNTDNSASGFTRNQLMLLAGVYIALIALFQFAGNTVQMESLGRSAFAWMVARWDDSVSYGGVDYSHGWLLPFVSVWLVWRRRNDLDAAPKRANALGLIVIVLALMTHYAGFKVAQTRLSLMSFIVLLWAVPFYLHGWSVARILLFPCAYLIFCIPLTFLDTLTFPLRMFATIMATGVLNGIGIEAARSGTRIYLAAGQGFSFDVADPCSGLRSLLAIAAITSAYAYITQKGLWRQWTLFLSAIPLAMFGNIVRIVTVAIVALALGKQTAIGLYHDYSGYFVFAVVVLLMVAIGNLLSRVGKRTEVAQEQHS